MRQVLRITPVLADFISFSNAALAARSVTARMRAEVPATRPAEFIRALQIASNRLSVAHAEVIILNECWSTSQLTADDLSATAYAIASSVELPSGAYCPSGARGTVAAPYALDDPVTGLPRSIFTVRLIAPVEAI